MMVFVTVFLLPSAFLFRAHARELLHTVYAHRGASGEQDACHTEQEQDAGEDCRQVGLPGRKEPRWVGRIVYDRYGEFGVAVRIAAAEFTSIASGVDGRFEGEAQAVFVCGERFGRGHTAHAGGFEGELVGDVVLLSDSGGNNYKEYAGRHHDELGPVFGEVTKCRGLVAHSSRSTP